MSTRKNICERIEGVEGQILDLEMQIEELKTELKILIGAQEALTLVENHGWEPFIFFSYYQEDEDEELGTDGKFELFLFHPSVDLSPWKGVHFWHNDEAECSASQEWEVWLKGLDDGQFVVTDTIQPKFPGFLVFR